MISGTPASALPTGHPFLRRLRRPRRNPPRRVRAPRRRSSARSRRSSAAVDEPRVTTASVDTEVDGVPARASAPERAIEKHAASAAPISCSGLAPGPSSKRDENEYSPRIESPARKLPRPDFRSPCHCALPFAGIGCSLRGPVERVARMIVETGPACSGPTRERSLSPQGPSCDTCRPQAVAVGQ